MFMFPPKDLEQLPEQLRDTHTSDTQSFHSTHPSGLQFVHTFAIGVIFCVPCDPPSILKEWVKQKGRVVTGYFLST